MSRYQHALHTPLDHSFRFDHDFQGFKSSYVEVHDGSASVFFRSNSPGFMPGSCAAGKEKELPIRVNVTVRLVAEVGLTEVTLILLPASHWRPYGSSCSPNPFTTGAGRHFHGGEPGRAIHCTRLCLVLNLEFPVHTCNVQGAYTLVEPGIPRCR